MNLRKLIVKFFQKALQVSVALSCLLSLFPSGVSALEIPELSRERLNKIISIISRYKKDKENPKDPFVKETILKEISEFVVLEPDAEIKNLQKDEVKNEVYKKVALRYPDSHKVFEDKTKAEAEKIFRMAKLNEYLSVKYRKGNNTYTQEGVFYEYGFGNRSVKIGSSFISVVDLFDDDRVKFDESFNKKKKSEYINSKIGNYYKIKQNYTTEVFNEIQRQLSADNERNGYIYAYNKWRSAKEVTLSLIDEIAGSQPEPDTKIVADAGGATATPGQDTTAKPDAKQTAGTQDPADKPQNGTGEAGLAGTDAKKSDLKRKAESEWMKIANTFPGIDGDQGYKPLHWFETEENAKIILEKELDNSSNSEVKYIKHPEKSPISSIDLHFFHGYFCKVVIHYRLAKTQEAMYHIVQSIRDKYGPPDQEKETAVVEGGDPAAPAPEPAPPPPEGQAPAEEPPPPPEETFTWTGKVTKGTLYIRRNPDGSLAQMDFIKENPAVQEVIGEELEKERKKKEQEEREKELEIYKKFNN